MVKLTPLQTHEPLYQALSATIKACNAMEHQTDMTPIRELLEKLGPTPEINQWLKDNQALAKEPETQTLLTKQAKAVESKLSTFSEKALAALGIKAIEKDISDPNTRLLLGLISLMDDTHRAEFLEGSRLNITEKELNDFNAVDYKALLTRLKADPEKVRASITNDKHEKEGIKPSSKPNTPKHPTIPDEKGTTDAPKPPQRH